MAEGVIRFITYGRFTGRSSIFCLTCNDGEAMAGEVIHFITDGRFSAARCPLSGLESRVIRTEPVCSLLQASVMICQEPPVSSLNVPKGFQVAFQVVVRIMNLNVNVV